jgi:hypothetical protein
MEPRIMTDGVRTWLKRYIPLLGFILVVGTAGAVLMASHRGAAANTPSFELFKMGVQLIAVAGLGTIATLIVQLLLESTRAAAAARKAADDRADARVRELLDQRTKRDDLLRSTCEQTVAAYNNVKRIRRRLRAATGFIYAADPQRLAGKGNKITATTYTEYMNALIDEQLQFEAFKRLSPVLPVDELKEAYRKIEVYLGKIIEEFETACSAVAAAPDGFDLRELRSLYDFLSQQTFYASVATPVGSIVYTTQNALLQPLDTGDGAEARAGATIPIEAPPTAAREPG